MTLRAMILATGPLLASCSDAPRSAACMDLGSDTLASADAPVVESPAPRRPDLSLADEPTVRIGELDGPLEYVFGDVTGAARLDDGSIVVLDQQSKEVRLFDSLGTHLWSSGRAGEGPGEYRAMTILRGCPGAPITIYDGEQARLTQLDAKGALIGTRTLASPGALMWGAPACLSDGRLAFRVPPDYGRLGADLSHWERCRSRVELRALTDDGEVATLRSAVPGPRMIAYEGSADYDYLTPRPVVAAGAGGVWLGTSDDHALELVDADGATVRVARWGGPDLALTEESVDRVAQSFAVYYRGEQARRRFFNGIWPEVREELPSHFPAYRSLVSMSDGAVWVVGYPYRLPGRELHLVSAEGEWHRRLMLPPGMVMMDAGPGWALIRETGELVGVERVALYDLVER